MLPFKNYREGSVSAPVESVKREPDEEKDLDSLEIAAEELCKAIEAKDYPAIAEALRAAFELLDLEPHKEGPHV